ncbi:MAG: radical SAM protein [Lachnospiraceae bacterium]|nr:radical SAM protein [Lachnospiraceae bacterium]
MKILLIKPETVGIFSFTYLVDHEPLEMEYLYTVFTKEGHEAVIYDRRYETISLRSKLNKEKPDVVCITGYITQQKLIYRLCEKIKKYRPETAVILGGSHVEINYANFYDSKADYLYHLSGLENQCRLLRFIAKEKETSQNGISNEHVHSYEGKDGNISLEDIPGICYRKNGEWICNPKIIETPEDLPVPDRTYFYKNRKRFRYLAFKPLALVKNSYSCQRNCNFCFCTNRNGGRYACRSVDKLVDEIASLEVDNIHITDDNFLVNREYLKEFVRLIRERDIHKKYLIYGRADFIANNEDLIKELADIGLSLIMVGLEATNDEELDSYNKHVSLHENEECIRILSENHIYCAGLFIVHQQMKKEDFDKLYEWIASRDIIPTVSVFTPMQGSAMYKDYEDKLITKDVTKQDLFHCLIKPEYMSVRKFTFEYYRLSMKLAWKNRRSSLYADNDYFVSVLHIIWVLLIKLRRLFVI